MKMQRNIQNYKDMHSERGVEVGSRFEIMEIFVN